jgi:HPt (histidine-containing phosphotransfer) domain-containing protein
MSQLLDLDTLNTLKDVIGDDLKEIIDSFLQLLPGQVDSIESSARLNDATNMRLHAHTLKGSASNVGALALSQISHKLEDLAKAGQTAASLEHMNELRSLSTRSADALRKFMA